MPFARERLDLAFDHRRILARKADLVGLQEAVAWYTQTRSWGMAPGFDRPDHDGVLRRVRRECIFCHASYPDLPAGADAYGAPQVFPARLPEGIGCQRTVPKKASAPMAPTINPTIVPLT